MRYYAGSLGSMAVLNAWQPLEPILLLQFLFFGQDFRRCAGVFKEHHDLLRAHLDIPHHQKDSSCVLTEEQWLFSPSHADQIYLWSVPASISKILLHLHERHQPQDVNHLSTLTTLLQQGCTCFSCPEVFLIPRRGGVALSVKHSARYSKAVYTKS